MIDELATGRSDAQPARSSPEPPPPEPEPVDLETATRQALLALPGRAADPLVCPFLRDADGSTPPRLEAGDHRCVAIEPSVVVGDRQRLLLCELEAHANCPRHVRGEAAVRATLAPNLGKRSRGGPLAIGTAIVLLFVAAGVALTSGVLPGGSPPATDIAGGAVGVEATARPPEATSTARPSPGPSATLAPVPTVRPTLVATRDLPAAWRGLQACPGGAACYVYAVRRGDTLGTIADRFGTTVRRLRRLNPALTGSSTIRVRQELLVPPPPD